MANTSAFLLNLNIKIMNISTQFKGTITELKVATYLLEQGYIVSQPLVQDSKYDLIIDVHNKLIRLQVKTARRHPKNKGESIVFNCRSTTNNVREYKQRYYSTEEVDFFATYWDGYVFLIPINECSAEKTLWLEKPKQSSSTYAYDYTAEEVLKNI